MRGVRLIALNTELFNHGNDFVVAGETVTEAFAHLEWLKAGGRVTLAGPLQSPEGEEAGNVGTLLVVNGDELGEVQAWAAEDPYNQAGLFASVLVAPLTQYALSAVGGMLTEL